MNDTLAGFHIFDAILIQRKVDLFFSAAITMLGREREREREEEAEIEKGRIDFTVCEEGN